MNPALLAIIELLLGTAENVIPLFIHNPKSNAVEGVIATVLNSVVPQLPAIIPPVPAAPVPATQLAQAHTQPLVNPNPTGPAVFPTK